MRWTCTSLIQWIITLCTMNWIELHMMHLYNGRGSIILHDGYFVSWHANTDNKKTPYKWTNQFPYITSFQSSYGKKKNQIPCVVWKGVHLNSTLYRTPCKGNKTDSHSHHPSSMPHSDSYGSSTNSGAASSKSLLAGSFDSGRFRDLSRLAARVFALHNSCLLYCTLGL